MEFSALYRPDTLHSTSPSLFSLSRLTDVELNFLLSCHFHGIFCSHCENVKLKSQALARVAGRQKRNFFFLNPWKMIALSWEIYKWRKYGYEMAINQNKRKNSSCMLSAPYGGHTAAALCPSSWASGKAQMTI